MRRPRPAARICLQRPDSAGYSLLELMFVVGLVFTLSAVAIPEYLAAVDEFRTAGAARYMAARVHRVRMEAVMRSANVALRFVRADSGFAFSVFLDGDGDGVRTLDIQRAIDRQIVPGERLPDHFSGVDFGVLPGLPSVEPGVDPPGSDPIKLGSSNLLSFSPSGTSSPGSVYIRGRKTSQYAVRVLGATGRIRVLKFNPSTRQWK